MSDSSQPHGLEACQTPLSMGFPRQGYWTGLPFPSLGDLLNPGIKALSLASLADFLITVSPGKLMTQSLKQQKRWIHNVKLLLQTRGS